MLTKSDKDRPTLRQLYQEPFLQGVLKEFIETKGIITKQEKIPIKKTLTHQEIKNIMIEEEARGIENKLKQETPLEKLRRKKDEENEKRKRDLMAFAKTQVVSKNQAKERKKKELEGNQSIEFYSTKNSFPNSLNSNSSNSPSSIFQCQIISDNVT